MDLRLAPELRLVGTTDRQVDLRAAVAAALAYALVDGDALRRVGASLPRLRSRRFSAAHTWSWMRTVDALDRGELALRHVDLRAVADLGDRVESDAVVARGVLGRDDDPLDALQREPARQLRHGELTDDVLAAGHRDEAVVEQLVGDVVPAAVAARIASDPEWWNVPSPRFWTRCSSP